MKIMIRKRAVKYCLLIIITIILMAYFVHIKDLESAQNSITRLSENKVNIASVETYTVPWLKNSNFSSDESWIDIKEGDITDISANINNSQANYVVIGEERTFSEISGKPINTEWTQVHNPEFPAYPDTHTINSDGCYVSHSWSELADQSPSVHWDRNITMPVNMNDYIITSASLSAIVNGTANSNVECPGDPTDLGGTQHYTYDYARFYILLSDLTKEKTYEAAYFQTVDLGQNTPPINTLSNTLMITVPEDYLKFFLSSVLSSDNYNFTITLGIRIWCEDNWFSDTDTFTSLIINSCSLNFTYQKKIDQFTSISYYQQGNSISGRNTQIKNATFNFKYKIDQDWPISLSLNSEIKILINNNSFSKTVKLSTLNTTFMEFDPEGIDVTYLIQKGVNISVSIQISIADTFPLDRNITVSVDDVYLIISYTVTSVRDVEQPWLFLILLIAASIISAGVGGYLIAYQRILKYPRPVRKTRKYRFSLNKKNAPDIVIFSRENAFRSIYGGILAQTSKTLKLKPAEEKVIPDKLKATGVEKSSTVQQMKPSAIEEEIKEDQLISKSLEKKEELDEIVDKVAKKG
jgi:hypothetical protein